MTFTLEDGNDIANANAYAAVADVDTYFSDRNDSAWTGDTPTKQAAIIKATQYVDQRWGGRLKGTRSNENNDLEFPRSSLYDRAGKAVTGIPTKLKNAVAEYAKFSLGSDLFPTIEMNTTGKRLKATREQVGPIRTEEEYEDGGAVDTVRILQAGDAWMKDYITSGRGVMRA